MVSVLHMFNASESFRKVMQIQQTIDNFISNLYFIANIRICFFSEIFPLFFSRSYLNIQNYLFMSKWMGFDNTFSIFKA